MTLDITHIPRLELRLYDDKGPPVTVPRVTGVVDALATRVESTAVAARVPCAVPARVVLASSRDQSSFVQLPHDALCTHAVTDGSFLI